MSEIERWKQEIEKWMEGVARRVAQEELERADSARVVKSARAEEAQQIRDELLVIKAKEFIRIPEAARLLDCSQSHLRNLVDRAETGKAIDPIPFRDLDGFITFNVEELLAWSKRKKAKKKAA